MIDGLIAQRLLGSRWRGATGVGRIARLTGFTVTRSSKTARGGEDAQGTRQFLLTQSTQRFWKSPDLDIVSISFWIHQYNLHRRWMLGAAPSVRNSAALTCRNPESEARTSNCRFARRTNSRLALDARNIDVEFKAMNIETCAS